MTKRILLIDADVVAYQCASVREHAFEWEPGFWTWHVGFDEVASAVDDAILTFKEKLDADAVRLCLTDPHDNFRLGVFPAYKMNRSTVRRPLVLYHIKEWLVDNRDAIMVPGLEGDDVMGILATRKTPYEQIIVSLDKDLKTIPGKYVRTRAQFNEDGVKILGAFDITDISEEEADRHFFKQALAGDVTDGYPGCPGIGDTIASKIVEQGIKKVPYEHTLARGPRKGQTETRFEDVQTDDLWEAVVSHYEAVGLGAEEALTQARCARILRWDDYDFKKKEVKLWRPN